MSGQSGNAYEPEILPDTRDHNEVVRNLLTVARNPHNDPKAVESAAKALENWRWHPAVAAHFTQLDKKRQQAVLRDRMKSLARPIK